MIDVLITASLSEPVRERVAKAVREGGGRPVFRTVAQLKELECEPEVIFGNVPVDFVIGQKRLRWLQTVSAGVDGLAARAGELPPGLVITNGSGVYGPAGGDHVMAMILYFTRGLGHYTRAQLRRAWAPDIRRMSRLLGQTLVVLGLGDLGQNVARRAKAFGMRVIGVKRTPGDVEGVDRVVTLAALDAVLPEANHLAITLPLTPATRGLLDRRRLALLPKGAFVYNIGRGAIIDEEALVEALQSGHLGGAGLDVFVNEPLPADHPLWTFENVLITPHLGANTPRDHDVAAEIFIPNWHRWRSGEPLQNVVDLQLGY